MKTSLKLDRETKGTFVYKDDTPNAPIPSVYIKKSAFSGDAPESITIEIKEIK